MKRTYLSSLPTTLARGDADAARERWQDHQSHCYSCGRKDYCPTGEELRSDMAATAAELRHQRELDKAPIPGQGELFGAGEL